MARRAETLLKDYNAKRDFSVTQEPRGGEGQARPDGKLMFVIQKHAATRLHYDFRIELDGVLKSWAVTKGPSLDPADKRLAVRVEDHPLDYGGFEGTIPKGEYGGGTVMLWDRGWWEPIGDAHQGLESGDLKMRLHGERMQGEWVLVHMKGRDTKRKSGPARENWLLIKHRDGTESEDESLTERFTTSVDSGRDMDAIAAGQKPRRKRATVAAKAVWRSDAQDHQEPAKPVAAKKGRLPKFRLPQLATLVDAVPEGPDWVFEMKYDGYRCIAAVAGGDVQLFTRSGKDWTEQFGSLVPAFSRLTSGSALIDGEICAFDDKGRTDFSTLKAALSAKDPLVFFAFDLVELDGEDLSALTLVERKTRLKALIEAGPDTDVILYSEHVSGNGQRVFDVLCREGHEGTIAKRAQARYRSERTRDWLKLKCAKRQEFVIGGFTPSTRRHGFASLLLGTFEHGQLIYRGRVGTGFTVDTLTDLDARLAKLAATASPFDKVPRPIARGAKWVKPELVAEIAFTEFTPDGVLRHPSFIGLREDKSAQQIGRETAASVEAITKPAKRRSKTSSAPDIDGANIAEAAGIKLTSPSRVVFPRQGVTKADLVAYYSVVGETMLKFAGDRPLSLLRCPQGRARHCFFQKHDTGGFHDAMKSVEIAEKDGEQEDYFYIDSQAGLYAGTQMNVLEWHIWGSKRTSIDKPERMIFDIDPDEGLDFNDVRQAARDIRDRLHDLELDSFPLVSGGKGIHVIVPLRPRLEWPDIKAFAKGLATRLAEEEPQRYTANMSKARRKGRMFIDYLRNERGSTAIAPWSVRSREGAPVAVPVGWYELDDIRAANAFGLADAMARIGDDPWRGYDESRKSLTKAMLKAVNAAS